MCVCVCVAGFLLFLGILLPGAAMSVWTFCECCYEEDEEEVEVNRSVCMTSLCIMPIYTDYE